MELPVEVVSGSRKLVLRRARDPPPARVSADAVAGTQSGDERRHHMGVPVTEEVSPPPIPSLEIPKMGGEEELTQDNFDFHPQSLLPFIFRGIPRRCRVGASET